MATIMTGVYDFRPAEPYKEKYYIDFSVFKGIAQRHKFKELQQIAFSKGIGWCGTGMEIETYDMLTGDMGGDKIIICLQGNSRWKSKYLAYGKEGKPITYRDLIKKLRSL